jgi:hypothetical protein
LPLTATVPCANAKSLAPVVPIPLEVRFTFAEPLNDPAVVVLSPTDNPLVLFAAAARPVMLPVVVKPVGATPPNEAFSASV